VAALLLHQRPVVLAVPQLAVTPHQRKRRRRRRVRLPTHHVSEAHRLTHCTEKEESDDDMGFGLFD
jgi:ribosomal protein L12E/L44/L45/RPP1/RPP2